MALELTLIDPSQLSPAVAQAVGPGAAGPVKMMAARGMAPMGPLDLVTTLYQLALDQDQKIAEAADATATKLPENILANALSAALDPRVLDFFARKSTDKPALMEQVLLNRAVHDETLVLLGGVVAEREVEILAGNAQRVLGCPDIIEAIFHNKQARMSTVNRLLERAVRNGLTLELDGFKEISASILGKPAEEEANQEEQANEAAAMDQAFSMALLEGEDQVGDLEYEEAQEGMEGKGLYDMLKQPLIYKIRMAAIGNALHRSILIKDTNKMVAVAVIKSPGVTDQEAARYAANRSLNEEVIRYIAAKKEWHKNYQIKVALVNNPKCPLGQSMRLINHLRANDLRTLARSKNIPATLARTAKNKMSKRS